MQRLTREGRGYQIAEGYVRVERRTIDLILCNPMQPSDASAAKADCKLSTIWRGKR